jgi:hypothetical protein
MRSRTAFLSFIMLILSVLTVTTVSAQSSNDPSTDGAVGAICLIYLCALSIPMIIWIVAAIFIYKDATKLNVENAWVWGLLTFLTGVIGLIIYLAVIRPKAKEKQAMGYGNYPQYGGAYGSSGYQQQNEGACRHCGKYVGATTGRCTYCGSDL